MSQLDKWMVGGKISKLVIVITDKDTGEHVERWQFDASPHPHLNLPVASTLTTCSFCTYTGSNLPAHEVKVQILPLRSRSHRPRKCQRRHPRLLRPRQDRDRN